MSWEQPLRGVFHAAGVLRDQALSQLDWEGCHEVLRPKVQGAWNLHQATRGADLDLFVLFSSVAATVGNRGQGNYALGNAWMNRLAEYRRSQGLPAHSLCWGPWAEIGMAAQDAKRGERMAEYGIAGLLAEEAFSVMWSLLARETTVPTVMTVDWGRFLPTLPEALRQTTFAALGSAVAAQPLSVGPRSAGEPEVAESTVFSLAAVRELPEAERVVALRDLISEVAARVMGHKNRQAIATDRSLTRMGLDSLMTMDFRAQLEKRGLRVPFAFLSEEPTLQALAEYLAGELKE